MPLTEHQKLHLDAVISDSAADKAADAATREKLARAKDVDPREFDTYRDGCAARAQAVLDADEWPAEWGDLPADCHRQIEEREEAPKRGTYDGRPRIVEAIEEDVPRG